MFEMTVSDAFAINNVYTVFGECNGFERLKPGILRDEAGKEYDFCIPLGKPLELDSHTIELQLISPHIDINALKGHRLIQNN